MRSLDALTDVSRRQFSRAILALLRVPNENLPSHLATVPGDELEVVRVLPFQFSFVHPICKLAS